MRSTSHIEIKLEALAHNVQFVRSLLKPSTRISAVIKGNAYGHGTHVMVPALEKFGVDHFSVYSSPEAKAAHQVKAEQSTLMIMGFIYPEDYPWVIQNEIEFYISNPYDLQNALEAAQELQKKAIVHIDVESGMNRTGLTLKQLKKAIQLLKAHPDLIHVKGITSHFAGAESIANHTRIRKQFYVFKKRIKLLKFYGIEPEIQHIASSAATINYPDTRLDLVRIGILLYGYWPTRETFIHYIHRRKDKSDPLRRALHWSSQVLSIKRIPEGEFIGYGMSFQAQQKMTVMIIPVGYSNGYSRSLSNNGHVIVKGQNAPVIGSVNMNMIICDISHLEGVKPGDPVVLIGRQGDSEISFSSFAEMNNSLNYEILARLPENIDRIAVNCQGSNGE